MADSFTPAARELIAKKVLAHVASLDPDGAPNVSPVWVELDGDDLVINTALGRAKARNLASDARVAVSVVDPDDDHSLITFAARSSASRPLGPTKSSIDWRRSTWGWTPTRIAARERCASPCASIPIEYRDSPSN